MKFRCFPRCMMMLMALLAGLMNAQSLWADTIPLQAQQTATREVVLDWNATTATTIVYRRYPGEASERQIAVTSDNHYVDHHSRAVCDDTVYYSISQTLSGAEQRGYAAVNVVDMDATAPAAWGVVTVEQQTIVLRWEASPDNDIMGYMVMEGSPSIVIDTVFGRTNTSYEALTYASDEEHHFRICAFDTCRLASAITEACNNIVVDLESQPCSRTVAVRWNAYDHMPGGLDRYEVWVSEDGGAFGRRVTVAADAACEATFEVAAETQEVTVYVCAYGASYTSYSNRKSITFGTTERPSYLYLRKVSTSDDGNVVTVVAQTDPAFEGDYRVYRSVDGGDYTVVGHCQPNGDGTLEWRDHSVQPSEGVYSYRIGVMDGCGRNEVVTQSGSTLRLQVAEMGTDAVVSWNPYEGWSGTTTYDLLWRPIGEEVWRLAGSTTGQEMGEDGSSSGAGREYKVIATEGANSQYQQGDTLQSMVVVHRPLTQVWMPNAFTPLESTNNTFGPQFVYVEETDYQFIIFNRQGLEVFHSNDPTTQWDGTRGGSRVPAGAYVYILRYRKGDGTLQEQVGTVLLVY